MRSLSPWILCSCLAAICSFIKRLFSWRKQKKEKLDLPVTSTRPTPEGQEAYNEEELQNWDTWGDDGGPTSIKVEPSEPQEEDFFADMVPQFKKAAIIRKKSNRSHDQYAYSSGTSSRLTMNLDDNPVLTNELETWNDEGGAWEEEPLDENVDEVANTILKEKREAERKKRAAEQQRKKAERDAQRGMKKDTKLAVKVS